MIRLPKGFRPLDETTGASVGALWTHPVGTYAPDPRKKAGLGSTNWMQAVVGLPGGEGFAAEGDDPKERLRAERDAWGLPNGQDPDVKESRLSEAAKSASNAKTDKLMLLVTSGGTTTVGLVRADGYLAGFISMSKVITVSVEPDILARTQDMSDGSDSVKKVYVKQVAARDGYGPLLYEIAMTIAEKNFDAWLTSGDANSSAVSVWDKFHDRDDVIKREIHDEVFGYRLKRPLDLRAMAGKISDSVKRRFAASAEKMWRDMYKGDTESVDSGMKSGIESVPDRERKNSNLERLRANVKNIKYNGY